MTSRTRAQTIALGDTFPEMQKNKILTAYGDMQICQPPMTTLLIKAGPFDKSGKTLVSSQGLTIRHVLLGIEEHAKPLNFPEQWNHLVPVDLMTAKPEWKRRPWFPADSTHWEYHY